MSHQFHIPVLGLAFSIDTPIKVARYGISSVVSIVDDDLTERMREYHAHKNHLEYHQIKKKDENSRAKRLVSYLDLMHHLVEEQFAQLKNEEFVVGSDICRYFDLLPENSVLKHGYELMMEYPEGERKQIFKNILRNKMNKGNIDVNIMAKLDKVNYGKDGLSLGENQTDALAGLRAFAESKIDASVVLSAGMNPRLYSYIEGFENFYPNAEGRIIKRIILKVSDYRSAFIQAKFLAKKGLWVSEFRIESGLNCGGHAFATDGYLLGPILEEFKENRGKMRDELAELYKVNLAQKEIELIEIPQQKICVQGGIGTGLENEFLIKYYNLDGTGWGSPFLLVPEVTNVDDNTLHKLEKAKKEDYYLSNASPLGIRFNNFRLNTMDELRLKRIAEGKPGSPCVKKYLVSNTEFTDKPICTASHKYQKLKIKELDHRHLAPDDYKREFDKITEKACLCEGLATSSYIKTGTLRPKESEAVSICPGPNLAYFNKIYSLEEMVRHIYGSVNLLENVERSHIFINELNLYIDYLQEEVQEYLRELSEKKKKYLLNFKMQLENGVNYYKNLYKDLTNNIYTKAIEELKFSETKLLNISID